MVLQTTSIADDSAPPAASSTPSYDSSRLNVEWSGKESGPGVVLLHGWGSSAELMRPIARSLSDRFRTANVDLPGHGLSPAPTVPMGIPEHADLVFELIRAHFSSPVSIVGHSNGGRIALYMASEPSMSYAIDRMVLVGPSGITPRRKPSYYVKKYVAAALKAPFQILPPRLRDRGLEWLRHSLIWQLLGSSDYRRLTGIMRDTFVRTVTFHLDDRVQHVKAPTLLFWGDQDQEISREQMSTLESRIPDAGLVVLEGAGHYAYLDDPITFLRATRHFLDVR